MEILIAVIGTIFCIFLLSNFNGFAESSLNIGRNVWHRGRPMSLGLEKATRIILFILLTAMLVANVYKIVVEIIQI